MECGEKGTKNPTELKQVLLQRREEKKSGVSRALWERQTQKSCNTHQIHFLA